MSTSSVRDEIHNWITEMLAEVSEQGTLAIIGLVHYDGRGMDNEIFSMKAGSGKWNNIDAMSDSFFGYANRHARGLIGAQQFCLNGVFGNSGKATRFLPFGLTGALQFGAVPGSSSTEAPTDTGMRSQGMRLAELVTQGMLGQINPTFHVQANLIERLMNNNRELSAENRELFIALRNELERSVELAHERKMKELTFLRTTEERRRVIKILPALMNAMTGKEIFPASTEDTALIESFCENVNEEEIKTFTSIIGQRSPELSGLMMNRFHAIQKRKIDEAQELKRLAKEAVGGYEAGERDAAGEATRTVGFVKFGPDKPNGQNGQHGQNGASSGGEIVAALDRSAGALTAGQPQPAQPQPPPQQSSEDTKLLDDLIGSTNPAQFEMLCTAISLTNPDLAARLKGRYAMKTSSPSGS